jgi:predicted phage baseplate assembly protein
VLDHLIGEVRFGNGIHGLIPPIGVGNLRLTRYQTGGGTIGNQPAGAVMQLNSSIPSIDKAVNPIAATGGADAETAAALLERMSRTLRHRDRAVTEEDYEDLARLASPAVARTRCVPLKNLAIDPLGQGSVLPGTVSVILVPRSTEAKPVPSLELIHRVQTYLQDHAIATAEIVVVGPLYVGVNVTADIGLTSLDAASTAEPAIDRALQQFLHPLNGGSDGSGWDFGREPHTSDLYALLETIPGVDHVRSLQMTLLEDQPGATQTDRFLVYSGTHTLHLTYSP